jgi:hypothetical protein
LLDCFSALLERDVDGAADLAERYWEEAAVVPVSRVQPLPLLTLAWLAAGRTAAARAATDVAAELVTGMAHAPLLEAAVHHSRAQLGLDDGDPHLVTKHARALLDIATGSTFRLQVIDALELLAAVAVPQQGPESRSQLLKAARDARASLGYRFSMLPGEVQL